MIVQFILWMTKGTLTAQLLIQLNIVTNQLKYTGIEFDEEVSALMILICSLENKRRVFGENYLRIISFESRIIL